jgi:hypothetical protein
MKLSQDETELLRALQASRLLPLAFQSVDERLWRNFKQADTPEARLSAGAQCDALQLLAREFNQAVGDLSNGDTTSN